MIKCVLLNCLEIYTVIHLYVSSEFLKWSDTSAILNICLSVKVIDDRS